MSKPLLRVMRWNKPNAYASMEEGATKGAQLGIDLTLNGVVVRPEDVLNIYASPDGGQQFPPTYWRLIQEIPPNVTALANTSTTGLYVVTGTGTSATREIMPGDAISVSDGDGVTGNPIVSHGDTSSVTDISANFTGGTVPGEISFTFDQFGHVLTRTITGRTLDHNDTGALQGGSATERYHFTAAEHTGLLPWATEDPADYALITQTITNGDTTHAPSGDAVFDALASLPTTKVLTGYGTGSVYVVTATSAAITMGTTNPVITINEPGTWLIRGFVRLFQSGAVVPSGRTFFANLRRTNNTAANIANGSIAWAPFPTASATTYTIGVMPMPEVVYTTANSDDQITIFVNISAALDTGQLQISGAQVIAHKISD